MQLLPATAKGIAIRTGGSRFRVSDLDDPELNVRYGSWYLRHLLDKYGDERPPSPPTTQGQENVDRWRASGCGIAFGETRHYVARVEHLKSPLPAWLRSRLYGITLTLDRHCCDVIVMSLCSYRDSSMRSRPTFPR